MLRFFYAKYCFLGLILFLWPTAAPAQQLVMPPPSAADSLPPDPDLLPPPPQLEWAPLGPKGAEETIEPPPVVAVAAAEPEPSIAPPPPPTIEIPLTIGPGPAEMELLKPEVEIWRAESESPQVPSRQLNKLAPAYVTGTEPVWLRVQFDPLAAGKTVYVKPSRGIVLDPQVAKMTVPSNGECMIPAQVVEGFKRSHIMFYCGPVTTVLPVVRASLADVIAAEEESRP